MKLVRLRFDRNDEKLSQTTTIDKKNIWHHEPECNPVNQFQNVKGFAVIHTEASISKIGPFRTDLG